MTLASFPAWETGDPLVLAGAVTLVVGFLGAVAGIEHGFDWLDRRRARRLQLTDVELRSLARRTVEARDRERAAERATLEQLVAAEWAALEEHDALPPLERTVLDTEVGP